MCLCSDKYISFDQSNCITVQLTENNNNKNQQWHIVSIGNNYEIISESNGKLLEVFGSETICGACITTLERSGELNQQFKFVTTTKTLPPPPPPKPQPLPPQVQQQIPPPSPDSYFPIGQKNGIPGQVGKADFNVKMLKLLKSGKLKRP